MPDQMGRNMHQRSSAVTATVHVCHYAQSGRSPAIAPLALLTGRSVSQSRQELATWKGPRPIQRNVECPPWWALDGRGR